MHKTMFALAAASLAVPAAAVPQNGKTWRGADGQMRCKRADGTTGSVVGAAGGALLGRTVDTKGERATGVILGAAAGALLGRKIDRNRYRCR